MKFFWTNLTRRGSGIYMWLIYQEKHYLSFSLWTCLLMKMELGNVCNSTIWWHVISGQTRPKFKSQPHQGQVSHWTSQGLHFCMLENLPCGGVLVLIKEISLHLRVVPVSPTHTGGNERWQTVSSQGPRKKNQSKHFSDN